MLIASLTWQVRVLQTDFHFEVTTARRTYLFRVDREYHNAEQRRAYDAQARGGVAPVTAPPLGGDLLRSRESSLAVPDVAEGVASGADLLLAGSGDDIAEGLSRYVDAGATDLRITINSRTDDERTARGRAVASP